MAKVGFWGIEPARMIALVIGSLVLAKKLFAPTFLSDDNIAAINEWLLLFLPIIGLEVTRHLVYAKGKVDAVVSEATQQQITNVKASTLAAPMVLLPLLLAGGLMLSGCASANRGMANAEDRIHDAIAGLDDRVRKECPPPADLTHVLAEVCQEARKEVEAVRATGQAFNEAVTERKLSSLGPLITAGGNLQTASVKGFNALMQTELARLIRQIIDAAMTLSTASPATKGGQ